ncbi:hypothetical protein QFZ20_000816 [Flavobacterium sp. W4I14]|nr:hypothetical protein [Flavobacterium sp. W4I14]
MKERIIKFASSLLIILWIYTGGSKLLDFISFEHQLTLQNFSPLVTGVLKYTIPIMEVFTAVLLCIKITLRIALVLSLIIIGSFTVYTLLVLTGFYPKIPCSCGGIIKTLSWRNHLIFNLFFFALNITAISLSIIKERRPRQV